jgi:hypothetical protein
MNSPILFFDCEDIDLNTQKSKIGLAVILAIVGTTARAHEYSHNGAWTRHDGRMGSLDQNPTIQTDRTTLDDDFLQLRGDREAGDNPAVIANQAKLMGGAAQWQADKATLQTNIKSNGVVQGDKATIGNDRAKLWTDRIQIRSDNVADNTSAVAAGKATLASDRTQLQNDLAKLKQDIDAIVAVALR